MIVVAAHKGGVPRGYRGHKAKTCTECKKHLPIRAFAFYRSKRNGRFYPHAACRRCKVKRDRERWQRKRAQARAEAVKREDEVFDAAVIEELYERFKRRGIAGAVELRTAAARIIEEAKADQKKVRGQEEDEYEQ